MTLNHSQEFSAEVEERMELYRAHTFMVWGLIKHRSNFIFFTNSKPAESILKLVVLCKCTENIRIPVRRMTEAVRNTRVCLCAGFTLV